VAPAPRPGDSLAVEVLGAGRATAVVERVVETRPMGIRDLCWRLHLRLEDGTPVEAIVFGDAAPAFLDPRYRLASGP
jgi:hypothetical protein